MKFKQQYTVKWHDTDANRQVTPSQIMMYLQETANIQLAKHAISLDELRDRNGLAFLLSSISVCMYQPLYAHEQIEVQTWIGEGHGFSYNRYYSILKNGEPIVEAASVWALMNLRDRRLLKASEAPYRLDPDESLQLTTLPRRLRLPHTDGMELVGERKIVYSDIDYNGHMNNTHYANLFCDFTPESRNIRVTGMMFSFLHEAAYGEVLQVYRAQVEGGYVFRLIDPNGTVCTEAMLRTRPIENLQGKTHV